MILNYKLFLKSTKIQLFSTFDHSSDGIKNYDLQEANHFLFNCEIYGTFDKSIENQIDYSTFF